MFRRAVNEQRFERRKEVARGSGSVLARAVLAEFGAQLGLDIRRVGHINAAQFQPLELGEQTAPPQRRQPLQEVRYPVGPRHRYHHPRLAKGLCHASAYASIISRKPLAAD